MVGDRPIPKRIAAIVGSKGTSKTPFISYSQYIGQRRHLCGFFALAGGKPRKICIETTKTAVKSKTGRVNPARFKSYRNQINRQPINRQPE
jgi:hypothetical protein